MKQLSLTLFLVAICYFGNTQSHIKYDRLTTEDGLSSNVITNIFQDSFGFIWIATNNGLNRYDGYEFKTYLPIQNDTTSISGTAITSIFEDKERNLWFGTWSSGLNLFDRKTENFKRFMHNPKNVRSVSSNSFVNKKLVQEDAYGNLWIGTDNGINIFDRVTGKFKRMDYGLSKAGAKRIRVIHVDKYKNLWVGTDWGGLYRYNYAKKVFEGFFPEEGNPNTISHTTPMNLLEDNEGNLWILHLHYGLDKLHIPTMKFQKFPSNENDPNSFEANHPLSGIIKDKSGMLWITTSKGLCKFDPKTNKISYFELENEHFQGGFGPIIEDNQGNYWIGSYNNGIVKLINNTIGFEQLFHEKNDSKSLSGNKTTLIGVDHKGNIFVNTGAGIDILDINKNRINTAKYNSDEHSLIGDNEMFSFNENKNGDLIFTGAQRAYKLNLKTATLKNKYPAAIHKSSHGHNHASGPGLGYLSTIIEDKNYKNWYGGFGISEYIDSLRDFGRYYPYGKENFATTVINTMIEAPNNSFWVGGPWDGLFLFDKKERKFIKQFPIGTLNNKTGIEIVVIKIFRDSKNRLWLGTDNGLSLFNETKGTFKNYGKMDGLKSNQVNSIVEDNHQNLWLGTANGLTKFNVEKETFRNYDYLDGLQGNEFISTAIKHPITGELWFGGNKGLNVFNPDSLKDNNQIPPVVITKMTYYNINKNKGEAIIDNTVTTKNKLAFDYDDNIIEFQFSALNYINTSKNKYAYRLIGFKDSWVHIAHKREVSFTNLSPGKYTFQVKASNNDGIWNEKGTSIEIKIYPPWWQTWWAYLLYALTFAFILRKYIQFRNRKLLGENIILENKVHIRTNELEIKSTELEKSLNNLKTTQTQLIQSEKLASLGELTAGIAHEIQNPLNFVNNFSELSLELSNELNVEIRKNEIDRSLVDDLTIDLSQNQEKINFHGKRASSIVKSMLEHSRPSTGNKELTDINLLVDEYLRLSYHGLRAKDKTFNSNFKTEFDNDLPKINIIPQDIGRVILNLINNAFYSVSKKAKLAQENNQLYEPNVAINTQKRGTQILIEIKDNGTGMSEEIKDKIYQPFFTTKPAGEGTGLGLSLAYDIVTKGHGGTIECITKIDIGTNFIVQLPITD